MIARVWHGRTKVEAAAAYAEYVKATGISAYRSTPGYQGSLILQRHGEVASDIYVLSLWASMDAVRRFAGESPETPSITRRIAGTCWSSSRTSAISM